MAGASHTDTNRHLAKVVVDISFQREYVYLTRLWLFLTAMFKHKQISEPFAYANAGNSEYSDMATRGVGVQRTKLLIRHAGQTQSDCLAMGRMRPFNTCASFVIEYDKSKRKVTPLRIADVAATTARWPF